MSQQILEQLDDVIKTRRQEDPEKSYVADLFKHGLERIQRKVHEESLEAILAAQHDDKQALINEIADLWFHSMVLLAYKDASANDVLEELKRRFGVSGIEEKVARNK